MKTKMEKTTTENELSKWISETPHRSYRLLYNWTRFRRFIILTALVFIFQFLSISNLTMLNLNMGQAASGGPAANTPWIESPLVMGATLPFYPAIGIAFIVLYLWGSNTLLGLILAGGVAYYLKGFSCVATSLYLIADIGVAYLGAYLCRDVFSSDIKPFSNWRETLRFLKINAWLTLLLSSPLRVFAIAYTALISNTSPNSELMQAIISFKNLDLASVNLNNLNGLNTQDMGALNSLEPLIRFATQLNYEVFKLWLADLNAIIILSIFVLTWVYVPLSRVPVSKKSFKELPHKITLILTGIFIIVCLNLLRNFELIYLLLGGMIGSCVLMRIYGQLIGILLLFLFSCLYLGYFMVFGPYYYQIFGAMNYTFVPLVLSIYLLVVLRLAKAK